VLGSNVEAVVNCLDSHNSRKTRSTMFGKLFSYNTETGSARNDALPGPPVQKVINIMHDIFLARCFTCHFLGGLRISAVLK
jgi:hypothetical protein